MIINILINCNILSTVKSYFDKEGHQHAYHNDPNVYSFIIEFLKGRSIRNNYLKVLDFGCGDGSFIKSLLNSNINAIYYGTDISDTMIHMAKSNVKSPNVNLFVSDGFRMPLSENLKFDLIHLDSVIHHLIGNTLSETKNLVDTILNMLFNRLKIEGTLILEENYYNSYFYPSISSTLIFYGLRFFNRANLDISKIIREYHKGLEVRFLTDNEIMHLLKRYGDPTLIKRIPWNIPKSYRIFLLKNFGHVTYGITRKEY
jgi:SAM-dependent methyltransferase